MNWVSFVSEFLRAALLQREAAQTVLEGGRKHHHPLSGRRRGTPCFENAEQHRSVVRSKESSPQLNVGHRRVVADRHSLVGKRRLGS